MTTAGRFSRLAMSASVCGANLLVVYDQELFARQLGEILKALDTELEIVLAPEIGPGSRVRVKSARCGAWRVGSRSVTG